MCNVRPTSNKLVVTSLVAGAEDYLLEQATILTNRIADQLKIKHPWAITDLQEIHSWLITYLISNEQKILNFETFVMHRFGSKALYPDTSVMFNPTPFMEA